VDDLATDYWTRSHPPVHHRRPIATKLLQKRNISGL
jgi:hypothetical protein